jgi:ribonuclease Z
MIFANSSALAGSTRYSTVTITGPLSISRSSTIIGVGQKIAYVTDVAWHQDNVAHIVELARDADLLYIEAAFMERDAEHGQRKFHLNARQAGEIARAAHVGSVIPMHFSPRYVGEDRGLLRAEVEAAFGGASMTAFQ